MSEDGQTIVYEYSTASKLPQIYRAQLDGAKIVSPVQITKLNEGLVTGRTFAKTEVIRWKGSLDEEVEGILYYPTNYEAGKKYPVITAIHGGPTGWDSDAWDDNWAYPVNLMTQRGAFVLRPNYHGSANYGLKWVESICCGKYYDLETPDINMGVDYLISKGMADPDRIATLGWSNGSILSINLITTYPARYKAASVGAGDVEWISDWGNVDFGDSFDSYYFGKSPMEDPQLYIKKSPFFKMDKVQAACSDFSRLRGSKRSSSAKLVVLPRAGVLRQSSGEICGVPRRAARPAEADTPDPQSGRRSRVVRQILLQDRQTRKRGV